MRGRKDGNDFICKYAADNESAELQKSVITLKPCPFCGGKAEYNERTITYINGLGHTKTGISETIIYCAKCGARQINKWTKLKFQIGKVRSLTCSLWNERTGENVG